MDPDYTDEEEDAEAQSMAAMMGFSGFGTQKSQTKKRKFNAETDAYVDGQELEKIDKGGKKGQGSGGNNIPLGKVRVFGGGAKLVPQEPASQNGIRQAKEQKELGNDDEIDLGEDSDELGDGPIYIDTSRTPPAEADPGDELVDGGQSAAVPESEAREAQARIDAILSSLGVSAPVGIAPHYPAVEEYQKPNKGPQKTHFDNTAFMLGGPRPQANPRGNFNDSASVASSSLPSHRGGKNPTWYIDYYDSSFNENPWEELEKENGLEALCKWPENVRRRQFTS